MPPITTIITFLTVLFELLNKTFDFIKEKVSISKREKEIAVMETTQTQTLSAVKTGNITDLNQQAGFKP